MTHHYLKDGKLFEIYRMPPQEKIQRAKMVFPKMKTKRVWISCYFNMYNAIVIFSKKPHMTKAGEGWQKLDYDYFDLIDPKNKNIVAGVCGLGEFKEFFPSLDISPLIMENGNVISMEPTILVDAKLTALWEGDKLMNIDFSLDGYQHQS